MKHLVILLVGVCLLFASIPAHAQSDEGKQEVIKADRARNAAREKGDGEAWAKYISDDCIWANVITGEVLANKKERVTAIDQQGKIQPRKLTDEKVYMFTPNIVIQTGLFSGTVEDGPTNARFVRIYEKLEGRWQMIALYLAPESN